MGSLDITACKGDLIHLELNTTNFFGRLLLYGPSGALLATVQNNTSLSITYTTTNSGVFTVLVSSFFAGDTGTYGLTANGLSYELRFCTPVISGVNLTIEGVGGTSNAVFVIYSTTNVTTPFASGHRP